MERHEAIAVLKHQHEVCRRVCPTFGAREREAIDLAVKELERDDKTTDQIPGGSNNAK